MNPSSAVKQKWVCMAGQQLLLSRINTVDGRLEFAQGPVKKPFSCNCMQTLMFPRQRVLKCLILTLSVDHPPEVDVFVRDKWLTFGDIICLLCFFL